MPKPIEKVTTLILSPENLNDISDDLCSAYLSHRRQAAFLEASGADLTKKTISKIWQEAHVIGGGNAAALSFIISSPYQEERVIRETITKVERRSKYRRNGQPDATHA